jgi:hypothetical protein
MMWDCDFPLHCVPNKSANGYPAYEERVFPRSVWIHPASPVATFGGSTGGSPNSKSDADAKVAETLRLQPKPQPSVARQLVTVKNPAYDEPPSPEEYAYARGSQDGPKLFVMTPIPTLHTLLGAPRAALVTLRAIFRAGGWAITIFAACFILYLCFGTPVIVFLFREQGKKGWENAPAIVLGLFLASPFIVSYIVGGIQWTAAALGSAASWMVGLWVMAATWSAAISVLVGIPHVWKAPREVKEAYHVVRHGVEVIEKE